MNSDSDMKKFYNLTIEQKNFMTCCRNVKVDGDEADSFVVGTLYYDDSADFDADAMERAYLEIIKRNDALRMRIVRKGFETKQFFRNAEDFGKPVRNEIGKSVEDLLNYCRTVKLPFITVWDEFLTQAEICTCEDGTGGLIIWNHHICTDGYSSNIIIYEQLCELYKTLKLGGTCEEVSDTAKSFTDYIQWEEKNIREHKKEYAKALRKEFNTNVKEFRIPVKGLPDDYNFEKFIISITGDKYREFDECCKSNKLSDNVLIMSAVAIVVKSLADINRFSFDLETHGRRTYVQKHTVGPLLKQITVFFDFGEKHTLKDFLKDTVVRIHSSMKNTWFTDIESALRFKLPCYFYSKCTYRDDAWMCFNNKRNYISDIENGLKILDIDDMDEVPNAFCIDIIDNKDGLDIIFIYIKKLVSEQVLNLYVNKFKEALDYIIRRPEAELSECIEYIKSIQ